MVPHLVLVALAATLTASFGTLAAAQRTGLDPPPCNFSAFLDHAKVTSWEFQLDVPPDKCTGLQRDAMLNSVETALSTLGENMEVDLTSLRTSVFDQISTAVATFDGRPLSGKPTEFPWSGPAFLRLRKKYAAWHGNSSSTSFSVRPGTADLTLKIKNIDLDTFQPLHEALHFPQHAERCGKNHHHEKAPHLKWKIENDRYCTESRPTYEANYHPVKFKTFTGIRSFKDTERCFPGLWKFLKLPNKKDGLELPEYNRRSFSKSVWDVQVAGFPGIVNWVASYTTLIDALTGGGTAVECELSLRLKRSSVKDGGGEVELKRALNVVIQVMETLHNNGWDTGVHDTHLKSV